MEWPQLAQSLIGSAVGSSPAAALSFYWAKLAWRARESAESAHSAELAAKDALIREKDAQIQALQQARIDDLRQVLTLPTAQKPADSKQPLPSGGLYGPRR